MDAYYIEKPESSIGIFQRNMITQFCKIDEIDELHILTNTEPENDLNHDKCHYYISGRSLMRSGLYIARLERIIRPDVLFYTFNLIPPIYGISKAKKVLQNHDWSHGRFESELSEKIEGYIYQKLHRRSSMRADLNIANSEFTNQETRKYAGSCCKVIYHDADPIYKESIEIQNEILQDLEPFTYIIYAGRVRPIYKNIPLLLLTFKNLSTVYKNLKLVIVHSDEFNRTQEYLVRNLHSNLISMSNISKLDLKYLYKNSICMVYPSLYEGFGAPILEAQNSGTPVIACNKKPMTEVGGDGAVYFNGTIGNLMEKITIFIEDSTARRKTIIKGFKNADRFDWKTTAKKTVEVFHG